MAVSRTALPYPLPRGINVKTTDDDENDEGAVTIAAAQLAEEIGADLPRAERLLQVAAQGVLDYAPRAPEALLNEAVVRFAGYLAQSDYGAVRTETLGPKSVEYTMNHAAAFRNSGAAALLTRHKVRRGGSVG